MNFPIFATNPIKERQKEAYQQLETDAKGRKLSNKKTDKRGNKKVCGRPNAIENLTKEQKKATADEMIEYLSGNKEFSIVLYGDNAYTNEELQSHGLPLELSKQDVLDLAKIRYALSTNSFKKYMAVTIATNVSEKSVAAIKENQAELQGIDIVEDSIRKLMM